MGAEESRHAFRVLRHKAGDVLHCIDGKGCMYKARIVSVTEKEGELEIMERTENFGTPRWQLHVAVAITHHPDRYEWFVEKAVEIGVSRITPLITERTEKKRINTERLRKIALAAIKQSQRALLPVINEPITLKDFLKIPLSGQHFIAHCEPASDKAPLHHCIKPGETVTLLIGPEGDFSPAEIQGAVELKYRPVTISDSTLRTETAAVVCCHMVAQANMK
jgi:16S rRNA (uracil1498-N3)-methyltransferase